MELTPNAIYLGRSFRQQAERSLRNLQTLLQKSLASPASVPQLDFEEINYQANMAILSLLAAILAYIDPEYTPNDYDEESGTPSRPIN